MNRLILLAPLALFVIVAVSFGLGLRRDPALIPSVMIDRPLPAFDLAPIEGFKEGLSSQDVAGHVSMLNIFASWCISCRVEHPLLMELARSGATPIYGLNWKDKPGDGTAWLARFGNPYARIGDDFKGRAAIDLGVAGAPETFIIDKKGRIRYKQIGPITPDIWKETLEPLIKELEQEP